MKKYRTILVESLLEEETRQQKDLKNKYSFQEIEEYVKKYEHINNFNDTHFDWKHFKKEVLSDFTNVPLEYKRPNLATKVFNFLVKKYKK